MKSAKGAEHNSDHHVDERNSDYHVDENNSDY